MHVVCRFAKVNKGKTRFLENLPDWIDFGNNQLRELNLDAKILKVKSFFHLMDMCSYFFFPE